MSLARALDHNYDPQVDPSPEIAVLARDCNLDDSLEHELPANITGEFSTRCIEYFEIFLPILYVAILYDCIYFSIVHEYAFLNE